jgi:hypothetical protein
MGRKIARCTHLLPLVQSKGRYTNVGLTGNANTPNGVAQALLAKPATVHQGISEGE